jgi:hypothetical protein
MIKKVVNGQLPGNRLLPYYSFLGKQIGVPPLRGPQVRFRRQAMGTAVAKEVDISEAGDALIEHKMVHKVQTQGPDGNNRSEVKVIHEESVASQGVALHLDAICESLAMHMNYQWTNDLTHEQHDRNLSMNVFVDLHMVDFMTEHKLVHPQSAPKPYLKVITALHHPDDIVIAYKDPFDWFWLPSQKPITPDQI